MCSQQLIGEEEAQLLGFKSHADYILDIRMAKTSEKVFQFLTDLTQRLDAPARRDQAKLLELKKQEKAERNEPFDGQLNVWDWRYYDNLLYRHFKFQLTG